jgi:hypothetical protein
MPDDIESEVAETYGVDPERVHDQAASNSTGHAAKVDTTASSAPPASERTSRPSEQMIQKEVVAWAKRNVATWPALAMLYANPNEGRRHPGRGWADMGLSAGLPDLVLPVPRGDYGHLYLELKAPGNDLTAQQHAMIKRLIALGNAADVAWSTPQATFVLRNYLEAPGTFLPGY